MFQVGVGSGGMPVLDLLARDARVTRVTIVEPDVYAPHNVVRHPFPAAAVGRLKAELAAEWLGERRADLRVDLLPYDLLDPKHQAELRRAAAACDVGVCAADNEPAKYHFDALMRSAGKPWTLGEVLSGGIGGFVHRFRPGGPCYGCVASHLRREVAEEPPPDRPPDYSAPGGPSEARIPAGIAAIHLIASLHAVITQEWMARPTADGFTSLLVPLAQVDGVFPESLKFFKLSIGRAADCLTCGPVPSEPVASGDLDVALDQALARLGDA